MFQSIGIKHVVRAVLLGGLAFLLWSLSPSAMLKMAGVKPPARVQPDQPETVYHDKDGKRINEPDHLIQVGFDKARQAGIASHAVCKSMVGVWEQVGCSRYVTQNKPIGPRVHQGDFGSGKTTEQCVAEVRAFWEPLIQDKREMGDHRAADVRTRVDLAQELAQCQNYDNVRINAVIHVPAARLQQMLERAQKGEAVTAADRATVVRDLAGVTAFPDNAYKRAYLENSERFFRLADARPATQTASPTMPQAGPGPGQGPSAVAGPDTNSAPSPHCAGIQARLDDLARAEQRDQVKMAALRGPDGRVSDSAAWTALNQARIDRLAESQRYSDGAASCLAGQSR